MSYGGRFATYRLAELVLLYLPGAALLPGAVILFLAAPDFAIWFIVICVAQIVAAFPLLERIARRLGVDDDL